MTTKLEADDNSALKLLRYKKNTPSWADWVVVPSGYEITGETVIVGPKAADDKSRLLVTDSTSGTLFQTVAKNRKPGGNLRELRKSGESFIYLRMKATRL